ncbi:hypothetical protein TSUD_277650 [Trifolium subterraneum]|uniref:Uncharacterized protein n=1 Tax=Trifolium subterraneum TaxID=3900 RepID=A0A2Z6NYH7_TRISU|nr:hypothetical protein TSUD_277650 [Trifolium subterraneum]
MSSNVRTMQCNELHMDGGLNHIPILGSINLSKHLEFITVCLVEGYNNVVKKGQFHGASSHMLLENATCSGLASLPPFLEKMMFINVALIIIKSSCSQDTIGHISFMTSSLTSLQPPISFCDALIPQGTFSFRMMLQSLNLPAYT